MPSLGHNLQFGPQACEAIERLRKSDLAWLAYVYHTSRGRSELIATGPRIHDGSNPYRRLREQTKFKKKAPFLTEAMLEQASKEKEAELERRIFMTVTKTNVVGRPLPRYHPERSTLPRYYELQGRLGGRPTTPGSDATSGPETSDGGGGEDEDGYWDEDDEEDDDEEGQAAIKDEGEKDEGPPADLETMPVILRYTMAQYLGPDELLLLGLCSCAWFELGCSEFLWTQLALSLKCLHGSDHRALKRQKQAIKHTAKALAAAAKEREAQVAALASSAPASVRDTVRSTAREALDKDSAPALPADGRAWAPACLLAAGWRDMAHCLTDNAREWSHGASQGCAFAIADLSHCPGLVDPSDPSGSGCTETGPDQSSAALSMFRLSGRPPEYLPARRGGPKSAAKLQARRGRAREDGSGGGSGGGESWEVGVHLPPNPNMTNSSNSEKGKSGGDGSGGGHGGEEETKGCSSSSSAAAAAAAASFSTSDRATVAAAANFGSVGRTARVLVFWDPVAVDLDPPSSASASSAATSSSSCCPSSQRLPQLLHLAAIQKDYEASLAAARANALTAARRKAANRTAKGSPGGAGDDCDDDDDDDDGDLLATVVPLVDSTGGVGGRLAEAGLRTGGLVTLSAAAAPVVVAAAAAAVAAKDASDAIAETKVAEQEGGGNGEEKGAEQSPSSSPTPYSSSSASSEGSTKRDLNDKSALGKPKNLPGGFAAVVVVAAEGVITERKGSSSSNSTMDNAPAPDSVKPTEKARPRRRKKGGEGVEAVPEGQAQWAPANTELTAGGGWFNFVTHVLHARRKEDLDFDRVVSWLEAEAGLQDKPLLQHQAAWDLPLMQTPEFQQAVSGMHPSSEANQSSC